MSIEVLADRRREREEKIHSFTTRELLCLLRLITCQPTQTRQRGGSYDGPYLYTTRSVSLAVTSLVLTFSAGSDGHSGGGGDPASAWIHSVGTDGLSLRQDQGQGYIEPPGEIQIENSVSREVRLLQGQGGGGEDGERSPRSGLRHGERSLRWS